MDLDLIASILLEKGLLNRADITFSPLAGGVSSDIGLVSDGVDRYVVKQALPKLRVEDDWYADTARNRTEQQFAAFMQQFLPEAVPDLLLCEPDHHFFVMEYLDDSYVNWKQQLLQGKTDIRHAEKAAELLAAIHLRSWHNEQVKQKFDTTAGFKSLRIEPYLVTTGNRHPSLKRAFHAEAKRLEHRREALVHGDFSPKNIMVRPDRLVLLDHEVAWFGDPAFDLAFLLNHLYLKMLYHRRAPDPSTDLTRVVWNVYFKTLGPGNNGQMKSRTGRLLLMLMLARIDGKSPVEYLREAEQDFVRSFVYELLPGKVYRHAGINRRWKTKLSTHTFEH